VERQRNCPISLIDQAPSGILIQRSKRLRICQVAFTRRKRAGEDSF
jgi:hypothetical protein